MRDCAHAGGAGSNQVSRDVDTDDEKEALRAANRTGTVGSYWAERSPDHPAIISEHGNRTFAELNQRANRLARALRSRGVQAGDGVALMMSNRPEFAEATAAVQRIGMRLTAINWHLTAEEAAYIVDDCEATAFIADARFATTATGAAAQSPNARVRLAVGGEVDAFDSYEEALHAEDGGDLDDPSLGGSMLYTSGTTGRPKGVYRPRPPRPTVSLFPLGYEPGESLHLCTGPLYHAAPLAFSLAGPLTAGVGVALMDGWSPAKTLSMIERHRITHSHMVPTMFHRLLSLPDEVRQAADLTSLKHVLHGAAPCPVSVKRAIIEWWGPVLFEYYAATEGIGSLVTSEQWLEKPGTVGRPLTPDHVRIVGDDGNELRAGAVGTIYLKAPEVGRFEYFNDRDKTASTYVDDYFTMGDVGYLDTEGWLFLTDRSADLIISGGVNIYPAEVEAELLSHPAVADVGVIGVADDEWGEMVVAVVELRAGVEPSAALSAELITFCRTQLAHFKCPRQVDFVDALPRTDSGKLYKRHLRDQYRRRTADADRA